VGGLGGEQCRACERGESLEERSSLAHGTAPRFTPIYAAAPALPCRERVVGSGGQSGKENGSGGGTAHEACSGGVGTTTARAPGSTSSGAARGAPVGGSGAHLAVRASLSVRQVERLM
jgi:hypothetical protein